MYHVWLREHGKHWKKPCSDWPLLMLFTKQSWVITLTGEELVRLASTHLWPDPVCLFIWLSERNSSGKHRLFKNSLDKAVFKDIWNSPLSVNKSVLPLWLLSALSKTYKLGLRIKVRANSETHISRQLCYQVSQDLLHQSGKRND